MTNFNVKVTFFFFCNDGCEPDKKQQRPGFGPLKCYWTNSPSAGDEEEESEGGGAGGGRGDSCDWSSEVLGEGLEGGEVFGAFVWEHVRGDESAWCAGEFGGRGALGWVKVVVEEEEENEEGVGEGEGEEFGAVEEELEGPAVGETSGDGGGRKRGAC